MMAVNTFQQLPFDAVSADDLDADLVRINNLMNLSIDNTYNVNEKYDHSILSQIDPDMNYPQLNDPFSTSTYYDEKSFNFSFSNNNNLSLFHMNIRSIPKHFSDLKAYLANLKHSFSVIGISETWLQDEVPSYPLVNYGLELDYRSHKRGGGVSLYLHESLQYKSRKDLIIGGEINSVFVEIEKNSLNTDSNIIIGVVYRPPNSSIPSFTTAFHALLDKLVSEKKYIYIMGDYNVNTLRNIPTNRNTDEFNDMMAEHHLYPMVNKPTRVTDKTASIVDNIYSDSMIAAKTGILSCDISDHFPIFCIFDNLSFKTEKPTITKRKLNKTNIKKLNEALKAINWQFLDDFDTQTAFTMFQGVIDQLFDEICPKQTFTMTLTDALKKSIKDKNRLHVETKCNPNDQQLKRQYKNKRNQVTSDLRNAEIKYFSKAIDVNISDTNKTWKTLRQIIGIGKSKVSNSHNFCINGNSVNNSLEIANAFNDFFTTIGPLLANKIPTSTINPLSWVKNVPNSNVIEDVSEREVSDIIKSLSNSSAGWDGFPISIAKQCSKNFVKPLTALINSSFREGVFPRELKKARVVPIFKTGDKSLINNYRPISILSFYSKVFEKLMYNKMYNFIEANDILYAHQYGFRRGHSTQQAIITLIDKITKSVNSDDFVISVFIDLKKAFDCVPTNILLAKLQAYGIRGDYIKWFQSYLTDRTQYVNFNGEDSAEHTLKCGVPQGSILGPLFFIIFVNDMFNVSNVLFNVLYADDTCIYISGSDINDLFDVLNIELASLLEWLNANRLTLNVEKTFYMLFHRKRIKTDNLKLIIGQSMLKQTSQCKYLGLIIDNKLNWAAHIAHVKSKISKCVGILIKARPCLSRKCLLDLYYSFAYPYLIYCVEIWGHAGDRLLHPLFLVQKKIVRIITFSAFLAHTAPIFYNLRLLPLNKIVLQRTSVFMFKLMNNMLPNAMNSLIVRNNDTHHYNTRQNHHLRGSRPTCKPVVNSFSNRSVQIWNAISSKLNVNVSLYKFKYSVKLFLLENELLITYYH